MQMLLANLSSVAASSELTKQVPHEPSTLGSLASMVGGLIVVILLIFFLAYLVKRFNLAPSNQGIIKTLSTTPLGQKERLVLVEVAGQQYLLGVTAQQVSLIDKLENAVDIPEVSFATRLKQAKAS